MPSSPKLFFCPAYCLAKIGATEEVGFEKFLLATILCMGAAKASVLGVAKVTEISITLLVNCLAQPRGC
jgi:hypothetical protein